MDKIDEKILSELISNSRQSLTQLAKKTRVSRDVVQYRINQMKKKGIIRDFITNIDYGKMGFTSALLFISIKADAEKEFIKDINSLDYISWAGTHLGLWSLGMAIYGKNTQEVEQRFQNILFKYQDKITKHQFEFYKTTQFFTEKYFGKKKETVLEKPLEKHRLDAYDKIILQRLSKNSRITSVEISKTILLCI